MAELAIWAEDNGDATSYTYGEDPNNALTWDGYRVTGCLCDAGFHGYDCTLRDCPSGDDPGTYDDHTEVQLLQCIASSGTFKLTFRQQTTASLRYNATAAEVQDALMSLTSLGPLRVIYTQDRIPPNATLSYTKPEKEPIQGQPPWGKFKRVESNTKGTKFTILANISSTTISVYGSSSKYLAVGQGLSADGIFPGTLISSIDGSTVKLSHPTIYASKRANITVTNYDYPKGGSTGTLQFLEVDIPSDIVSDTPTGFCNIYGDQIAVISFDTTHGNLPPITSVTSKLSYVDSLGVTGAPSITVYADGESVSSGDYVLTSIKGTTENAVCNNRGICDESSGQCSCFPTWSSSDGQGGPGNKNDCGYRNEKLYSFFQSAP